MRNSGLFRLKLLCSAAAIMLAVNTPVFAQSTPQTNPVDPGRINEQLREQLQMPQLSPNIEIKEMSLIGAPDGADKITFTLNGMTIEGSTVYSDAALASLYSKYIGQKISLADVYRIANELTLKYRNDGYILTQVVVPPQTIETGTPRLRVVEGYIDRISIEAEGEGAIATNTIRDYVGHLNNGGPLNIKNLERQLLLVNDLPGVDARTIISPSTGTIGAADLLVIVERKPYDAMLMADNYGSRYLGQFTLGGVATLNSALGMNEALTAQVVYAPGDGYELLHGGLGYEQPIGPLGTRMGALVSVTDTEPGYTLEDFDIRGRANLYSLNISHPFIRTRNENLKGRLIFDWRDVKSSNNIEDTRRDHIRALRAGMRYDFLDMLLGVAVNSADLKLSTGLNAFGTSEKGDDNMSRVDGDPQFNKAELEVQRLQRLTNSVNLQLTGKGQLSSNALPSSEEFGVGGFYSGRGYDPSEIVGDDGISGQMELQWNNPVRPDGTLVKKFQLYTFLDMGRVWNQDATTAGEKRQSISSAGVGVRAHVVNNFEAGAGVAFPLTRRVESEGDRDPRFYINASKRF